MTTIGCVNGDGEGRKNDPCRVVGGIPDCYRLSVYESDGALIPYLHTVLGPVTVYFPSKNPSRDPFSKKGIFGL